MQATLLGSLCLFSLLTGLGSWLVSSPAPTWWPLAPGLWINIGDNHVRLNQKAAAREAYDECLRVARIPLHRMLATTRKRAASREP